MSSIDMTGKVAIVTGASSGIGRAIAVYFAERNCKLIITGRNMIGLQDCKAQSVKKGAKPENLHLVIADMKIDTDIDRLFNEAIGTFGKIDILISNHGMSSQRDDMSAYHEIMQVNLHSHVHLTRLCTEELVKARGVILYMSSITALHPYPILPYYGLTKASLDYFMRCTALNLVDKGVRVYSVNPGITRTEIFVRSGLNDEEAEAVIVECGKTYHALGRGAVPEEIATVVGFLTSDQAEYTTGVSVPVDGGWNKLCWANEGSPNL